MAEPTIEDLCAMTPGTYALDIERIEDYVDGLPGVEVDGTNCLWRDEDGKWWSAKLVQDYGDRDTPPSSEIAGEEEHPNGFEAMKRAVLMAVEDRLFGAAETWDLDRLHREEQDEVV